LSLAYAGLNPRSADRSGGDHHGGQGKERERRDRESKPTSMTERDADRDEGGQPQGQRDAT
jgi:hypothetical protein